MKAYKVSYEYKFNPLEPDNPNDPFILDPYKGETIILANSISEALCKLEKTLEENSIKYKEINRNRVAYCWKTNDVKPIPIELFTMDLYKVSFELMNPQPVIA